MNTLFNILIATFIISLIAFIGIFALAIKEKILNKILLILVALSAGALIGGAFLHLLPEAIEESTNLSVLFLFLIIGFCLFFLLEQFLHWHHCKHEGCETKKPFAKLILFSDGIHNFIDGLVIAGSFIINVPIGIATTIAIALHEIPQEIGDFGVLVYGGFTKTKALFYNFISALTCILGGILGFFLSGTIGDKIIYLLPFAAGGFIYIAASDLIPEIKHHKDFKRALLHFGVFLLGIILMFLFKLL